MALLLSDPSGPAPVKARGTHGDRRGFPSRSRVLTEASVAYPLESLQKARLEKSARAPSHLIVGRAVRVGHVCTTRSAALAPSLRMPCMEGRRVVMAAVRSVLTGPSMM